MNMINRATPEFKTMAFHNNGYIEVSNETFKGHWSVVIFMPAAFTYNCPTEVEDAATNYSTFQNSSGQSVYNAVDNNTHGKHLFQTAGTERMRIDSSGRVGIGLTVPATLLHLKTTSGDCDLQIEATGSNTDARLNLYGNSGGSISSNTYTIPIRNADGMFLDSSDNELYVIVRYKGDPAPISAITLSYS